MPWLLPLTLALALAPLSRIWSGLATRRTLWLGWRLSWLALALFFLLLPEGTLIAPDPCWLPAFNCGRFIASSPGRLLGASALALPAVWALLCPSTMPRRPYALVAVNLLTTLTLAILSVDHFVVRYALLELANLLVLAILLITLDPARRIERIWPLFVTLKLGDIALLALILTLYPSSGTYQIKTMLNEAGQANMPGLLKIGALALLVIWVKLSLPPFDWLATTPPNNNLLYSAMASLGLPLAGAYLLYHLTPLFVRRELRFCVVGLSSIVIVWLAALALTKGPSTLKKAALGMHGAMGLLLLGSPLMPLYLHSFAPLRWALVFWRNPTPETSPPGLKAQRLLARTACAAKSHIEQGILSWGLQRGVIWIQDLAQKLQTLHSGQLRRYLLWALSGGVIVGLFWMFADQGF